jgi:hypothetical protein
MRGEFWQSDKGGADGPERDVKGSVEDRLLSYDGPGGIIPGQFFIIQICAF